MVQNPFNGIESNITLKAFKDSIPVTGIHSMELKGLHNSHARLNRHRLKGIHSMELKGSIPTTFLSSSLTRIHSMELKANCL